MSVKLSNLSSRREVILWFGERPVTMRAPYTRNSADYIVLNMLKSAIYTPYRLDRIGKTLCAVADRPRVGEDSCDVAPWRSIDKSFQCLQTT
jgi:hypothetical protein